MQKRGETACEAILSAPVHRSPVQLHQNSEIGTQAVGEKLFNLCLKPCFPMFQTLLSVDPLFSQNLFQSSSEGFQLCGAHPHRFLLSKGWADFLSLNFNTLPPLFRREHRRKRRHQHFKRDVLFMIFIWKIDIDRFESKVR